MHFLKVTWCIFSNLNYNCFRSRLFLKTKLSKVYFVYVLLRVRHYFQFDQYSKAGYSNKTVGDVLSWLKIAGCILRESFKNVTVIFFFITEIFLLYSIIIIIRFYLSEQHYYSILY